MLEDYIDAETNYAMAGTPLALASRRAGDKKQIVTLYYLTDKVKLYRITYDVAAKTWSDRKEVPGTDKKGWVPTKETSLSVIPREDGNLIFYTPVPEDDEEGNPGKKMYKGLLDAI